MTKLELTTRLEFGKISDIAKVLCISFENAKVLLHTEKKMEKSLSKKSHTEWCEFDELLEDDDYLYK